VQQKQLIPPGNKGGDPEEKTGFDHYNFEGVYRSDDPVSPFHNQPITGKLMAIHTPAPGEDMNPRNVHCEYLCIQCGEPEGDQIWWWGESFPPRESKLTLKVATGKWEGLSGIGTWHHDNKEGFDLALACTFTFDIPTK